jgi:hypothetical protein
MSEIDEATLLRRELDRNHAERIAQLEKELDDLESRVIKEIAGMKLDMHTIKLDMKAMLSGISAHEPTMQSLEHIVGAGMVLRWIVIFIVGTLGAIGTAALAWESVNKWFR